MHVIPKSYTLRAGLLALLGTMTLYPLSLRAQVNVLKHHNDNQNTGANLSETVLKPANVGASTFGKLYTRKVNGEVYAQPLIASNVAIPGKGVRNVLYVGTMANTLYAFDADNPLESQPLWSVNFGRPVPASDVQCCCTDISVEIGILGTPVIDPATSTLYVVSRNKLGANTYHQWIHALDMKTGQERSYSPRKITGYYAGRIFDSKIQNQRPGLLLHRGVVYVAWASHNDCGPYMGWVMGFRANDLRQVGVYATTPTGGLGGIWQSGQGLTVDSQGDLHLMTGNGTFDANTGGPNLGNSFIKLRVPPTGGLQAADWFTPNNVDTLNAVDADLGSAGVLALPNTNLVLGGGKQGMLYLLDINNLGKFQAGSDTQTRQAFQATNGHIHGTPIYYESPVNGKNIYVWSENDYLKVFKFNGNTLDTTPLAFSETAVPGGMPGAFLSISANGADPNSGIVWAAHPLDANANNAVVTGIIRAYDANSITTDPNGVPRLKELWNSRQTPGRDDIGMFAKFCPPTIANGKVYMASFGARGSSLGSGQICVYGLLPAQAPKTPQNLVASAGEGQVELRWTEAPNVTQYNLYRSLVPNDPAMPLYQAEVRSGFLDGNVTNGTTYYYRVEALNSLGKSNLSNQASATPLSAALLDIESDAYTRSGADASKNFGKATTLRTSASTVNEATFLRFDLTRFRGNLKSVKVRLFGRRDSNTGSSAVSLYAVSDTAWSETGITWNNKPNMGDKLATSTITPTAQRYEWDVTAYVAAEKAAGKRFVTFALRRENVANDATSDVFNSKEAPTDRPQFLVTTTAYPNYPNGFRYSPDLVFNGNGNVAGDQLRLADGTAYEQTSVFHKVPVPINAFRTKFRFTPDVTFAPGEGMTFVIQRDSLDAIGAWGGGLGYSLNPQTGMGRRIGRSVAIKFDFHDDAGEGENSTGIYINGAPPTTPAINLVNRGIDFHWGHTYEVNMAYNGSTLSVTIRDLIQRTFFTANYGIDIPRAIGGQTAWVGFTASTSSLISRLSVLDWTMSP